MALLLLPMLSAIIPVLLPSSLASDVKQQPTAAEGPCLVGMCTARHSRLLEEHGIFPSASSEYCLLLKDFISCLNDSFNGCLSQLDFHSAITSTSKRWHKFQCQRFEDKKLDQMECQFWEQPQLPEEGHSEEEYEYASDDHVEVEDWDEGQTISSGQGKCAIFGQLHLRHFHLRRNAPAEWCTFSGARPLFDNRFFLVQVTGTNLTQQIGTKRAPRAVSKVAIIIRRSRDGCVPTQKLYLADASDPGPLSGAFQDGTNKVLASEDTSKKIIEIVVPEEGTRVDILLNHLASSIRVRKVANKFLNVFIVAPKRLLNPHSKHLCGDGCWEVDAQHIGSKNADKHLSPPSCEQQRVEELCTKLLLGRANLAEEWTKLCTTELLNSSPQMSAIWAESLRTTLDDLFGLAVIDDEARLATASDEQPPKKVNTRCTIVDAGSRPLPPGMSSSPTSTASSSSPLLPTHCVLVSFFSAALFCLSLYLSSESSRICL